MYHFVDSEFKLVKLTNVKCFSVCTTRIHNLVGINITAAILGHHPLLSHFFKMAVLFLRFDCTVLDTFRTLKY